MPTYGVYLSQLIRIAKANLEPGPSALETVSWWPKRIGFGHQASVSSADGPGSRLRQGLRHVSRFFNPSPALSINANAPGFHVWFICRNSNSSIVLTLILSVVTPNLSLNTYPRVSIVRFSEPVVIPVVDARAPSNVVRAAVAFTDLDFRLHEQRLPSLTLTFGFTGTSLTLFR